MPQTTLSCQGTLYLPKLQVWVQFHVHKAKGNLNSRGEIQLITRLHSIEMGHEVLEWMGRAHGDTEFMENELSYHIYKSKWYRTRATISRAATIRVSIWDDFQPTESFEYGKAPNSSSLTKPSVYLHPVCLLFFETSTLQKKEDFGIENKDQLKSWVLVCF